jgi:CheY-like chemotaxis protein
VRVLAVFDREDDREMLTFAFRCQGAEVTATGSAEEALIATGVAPPDVLVSEIALAGYDGLRLLEQVRALGEARGGCVPAVAVTGWARAGDAARAIEAGYQVHLAKPVALDTLVEVVAGLVRPRERASRAIATSA